MTGALTGGCKPPARRGGAKAKLANIKGGHSVNINTLKFLTSRGLLLVAAMLLMVFALAACGETTGETEEPGIEAPAVP
jgi:hypothetical protein